MVPLRPDAVTAVSDDLTPGPVQVPVTVALRIFIITDDAGHGPFEDDSIVASDVAIASSIWQQAGVTLVTESVRTWAAPGHVNVDDKDETLRIRGHDWDPGQAHVDLYYLESMYKGAGSSPFPWDDGPHAIILTDQEENQPKSAANWRGIALAHEFGHYLGLKHTHASDPKNDATYSDDCDDTDLADPFNVMTQGQRGRSKDPSGST